MADAMNATHQSMECPVCISIYTDPKILSCSHTICKTCLDKLLGCHGNCQIRCPFCRAVTQVPNEDVGKLQSNLALMNMIEDMKCHQERVLICGYNGKPSYLVYLQSCGKYVCTTCLREDFSGHYVRTISKISRRYCKCRKHPEEDEKCFCSSCRRFICLRCVDIEHKDEGHLVIEATAYESRHMKSIEDLISKVDKKRSCLQKYIDFIDKQMKIVDNAKQQCTSDINKAYDEAVRQLTEKRDSLLREVDDRTEGVEKELECMKTTAKKQINQLTTIAEMVTQRTKIPFDMDTLAAHDTLCEELREIIDQKNPEYEQPRKLRNKGKSVSFERSIGGDELCLGKIVNEVKKKIAFSAYKVLRVSNFALPSKDSMNTMVNTPDGRIALGCHTGGVNIFSAGGMLQQTVLKDRKVRGIGFLSDRHCVVIDTSNSITLYTPYYTKLNVNFETLSQDRGGSSKLTVDDEEDLIYVSYRKARKIQVFSTAGGQALREIPCNGYEPWQITSYDGSLITTSDDTIRLIDKEGAVQHELKKPGSCLYATLSQSDTILIAKVKHDEGLVSIDEYTNELRQFRKLVNDYKFEKPMREWYYIQQYRSGEIAFCTPDRLYIFPW